MITHYTTFNHYNDSSELVRKKRKLEACFVCYEIINNKKPIRLRNNCYYLKNCTCDGSIHKKCLDYWYNIKQTCPICRITILKNSGIMIKIFKLDRNLFLLIVFIKNNIQRIKKFLLFFLLVCFLYNMLEIMTRDMMDALRHEVQDEFQDEVYKY
jgi:hypothetical protein